MKERAAAAQRLGSDLAGPGLRHCYNNNNTNDDDKYREEIVGYFEASFLAVV